GFICNSVVSPCQHCCKVPLRQAWKESFMKCNKGQIRGNKRYLLPEVAVLCLSATVVAPSHGMDEFDQQAATVRALSQQETASLLQTLHEPRQAPLSADTATRVGAAPTDPPRL